MTKNRKELRDIMYHNCLSASAVANLIGCSATTVRIWRSVSDKDMPDSKLEYLKLKLQSQPKAA